MVVSIYIEDMSCWVRQHDVTYYIDVGVNQAQLLDVGHTLLHEQLQFLPKIAQRLIFTRYHIATLIEMFL
jgi:hypothetical protein